MNNALKSFPVARGENVSWSMRRLYLGEYKGMTTHHQTDGMRRSSRECKRMCVYFFFPILVT